MLSSMCAPEVVRIRKMLHSKADPITPRPLLHEPGRIDGGSPAITYGSVSCACIRRRFVYHTASFVQSIQDIEVSTGRRLELHERTHLNSNATTFGWQRMCVLS